VTPEIHCFSAAIENFNRLLKMESLPSAIILLMRLFLSGWNARIVFCWNGLMTPCKIRYGLWHWDENPMCLPSQSGLKMDCWMRRCVKPWHSGRGSAQHKNGKSRLNSSWFPLSPTTDQVCSKWISRCLHLLNDVLERDLCGRSGSISLRR